LKYDESTVQKLVSCCYVLVGRVSSVWAANCTWWQRIVDSVVHPQACWRTIDLAPHPQPNFSHERLIKPTGWYPGLRRELIILKWYFQWIIRWLKLRFSIEYSD